MVSSPTRPARARSAEEKSQRRDDILRAAERLWTTTPYAELSMSHVAREAGLAKGTLYLYFDTKEELFLALLNEHVLRWVQSVTTALEAQRPRTPTQVADLLVVASADLAPARRLLVLLGNVIERNVRPELTEEFRRTMSARVQPIMAAMPFTPETTMRLLMHCYALAIGWQQASEQQFSEAPALAEQEFEFALRAVVDRLAAQDQAG